MTRVGEVVRNLAGLALIETMRATGGRLPWLERHVARLHASSLALGLAPPPDDLADLLHRSGGSGERVVRLELHGSHPEITTRDTTPWRSPAIVVSDEPHRGYPNKTNQRDHFGRALAGAKRIGADDALLCTPHRDIAEGTAWNVFWWEGETLYTPAADLGILPGIARWRIMELTDVKEVRVPATALAGRSLFLANAVQGIVEIGTFERMRVPRHPRTAQLSAAFWPV
jgi:branched-subunit amino acid aminotransferase/4-amino-4-deoxychorismate lyase